MARPSKPHMHNGYWRMRLNGREIHLGADRRRAMQEYHRLIAARLCDAPAARPQTINGAIVAWLKLNDRPAYGHWLAHFRDFAGETFLDEVERDLLTRFFVALKDAKVQRCTYRKKTRTREVVTTNRPLSAKTIRHYVRTALAVLKWAHEQGWIEAVPAVPKLPRPMREARDLDAGRIAAALNDMHGRAARARQILRFIAATGCRPSEACRLQWEQVHLERGLCILPKHKTANTSGKPRTIYLTPEADQVLREVLAQRTRLSVAPITGNVFKNGHGQPYKPGGLRSILQLHADGATPYQLRHTFAQTASEAGLPPDVLAKLLGHASTETTAFYYEVRDERAVEAAKGIQTRAPRPPSRAG